MARRVLILGASGLLGKYILKTKSSTEFVESKVRIQKNSDSVDNANQLISEALMNQCDGILFLAWTSNAKLDYDLINQHELWVSTCFQTAILSIENQIHPYLVGTCLDMDPISPNYYIKAKSELRRMLSTQITNEFITWFRPHYIFNFDPVRPRILQELLASSYDNFKVHSPNSYLDYILAQDVAIAMSMAIENHLGGIIDIGSGLQISNRTFIELMSKHLNVTEPNFVENVEFKMDPADTDRLLSIGWIPSNTLAFLSDIK